MGGFIHSGNWLDYSRNAEVAKLADALDLGSSVRKDVWVQVPPSAPKIKDPLLAGLFHCAKEFFPTSKH